MKHVPGNCYVRKTSAAQRGTQEKSPIKTSNTAPAQIAGIMRKI
jgi:hypothetical protein